MRNVGRWVVLGLCFAIFAQAQSNAAKPANEVWAIRAGTLIDGRSAQPLHDKAIIIRGNRIEAVIDAGALASRNIARVVDFPAGVTVMPGMIESHTHIFLQGEDPAKGGYDVNILKYPLAYRAARATVSATSMSAVMLDMEGQIGVVAPGAFADIIAVQGDPLKDVNGLKNVGFVVKDGKVFKNDLR